MDIDNNFSKRFSLHDIISLFSRKKYYFMVPFIGIFSAVLIYALSATKEYRSEAKILIEQPGLQSEKASTLAGLMEHRIQIISQQILTRENLREMIRLYGLYPEQYRSFPELTIDKFRGSIELRPISTEIVDPNTGRARESTIAFLVAFEYTDPQTTKFVADHLVSLFLEKNESSRKSRVELNSSFLEEQAEKLSLQVGEQERILADFKKVNAGNLPELQEINLQLIARNEQQLLSVSEQLRSLREQSIFVEAELSQTSKTGMLIGSSGERILTNEEKLKTLRTELADVKRRYSNDHPDVKRLERQLIEAQRNTQKDGDAEFFASRDTAPDNPAYIQLQSKLKSLNTEIASSTRREAALRKKAEGFENLISQSPVVEKQYLALSRDYENVLFKYRETKQKVLQSQLSIALEESSQSDRFSLLESPRANNIPVRPNRSAIAIMGLLLALFVSVVAVVIADHMDTTVRNANDLIELVGGTPLGVIGYIESGADLWRRRAFVTFVTLVVVGSGLFAYFTYIARNSSDVVSALNTENIITMRANDKWNP